MTKKYTIAIDARRLRETTGRYTRELLDELQKIDIQNTYHVIIHDKDVGKWQPTAPNFLLHIVPWDHYTFGEQLGLLKFLNGLDADLVHFIMPQQPLFYKRPKVTTIHDMTLVKFRNESEGKVIYPLKQEIFKFLLKRVARTSEITFTDAEFTKDEIMSYANIPAEKIVIAHPSAGTMKKKEITYQSAEGKEFIMYTGNTFPYKNIPRLIQSHQQLLKDHPDLHLFIVGKVDENVERLQKEVSDNNYEQVHFTGFISDEELAWLYKHAKAYVFPSLSEGFGMPALEAMQFDLPVVSSDATVLPEIYGDSVHYFDPEDVDEMTKSIHEVLTDEKLRRTLVKKARKRIKLYSWAKMAKIIHEQYINVLNRD